MVTLPDVHGGPLRNLLPLLLLACGSPASQTEDDTGATASSCEYPSAVEPMALNQALFPYSWAQASLADGRSLALDLVAAYCNADSGYDWSPHDYMLLVSVPAW